MIKEEKKTYVMEALSDVIEEGELSAGEYQSNLGVELGIIDDKVEHEQRLDQSPRNDTPKRSGGNCCG